MRAVLATGKRYRTTEPPGETIDPNMYESFELTTNNLRRSAAVIFNEHVPMPHNSKRGRGARG